MDDRNIVLLGFFKSPFVIDIHELIMIAISKIFFVSFQLHVQERSNKF